MVLFRKEFVGDCLKNQLPTDYENLFCQLSITASDVTTMCTNSVSPIVISSIVPFLAGI